MQCSVQLRRYLIARADGVERAVAAELCGLGLEEARLTDIARDKGELDHIDLTIPTIGHNSKDNGMAIEDASSIAAQELRLFVERIERLEEEKKGIADDIKEIKSEMRGRGYDTKIVGKLLAIRKMRKGEHEEQQALIDTYMNALGMLADTPLGQAAMGRIAA